VQLLLVDALSRAGKADRGWERLRALEGTWSLDGRMEADVHETRAALERRAGHEHQARWELERRAALLRAYR
jgi:hypothetical protein